MIRTLVLSYGGTTYSRSFTLYSLLAALYLVVALSVPGTFLIARQASAASSSHLILALERSSLERTGGSSGEDRGEGSWTGPKRLRGVLLSKVGIDEIAGSFIAPLAGNAVLLEHARSKPDLTEAPHLPGDAALPQELLGRSPPSSR